MSGFQSVVNIQPAPAVEGDFASANPRASALAGAGQLVAGPGGVTVGQFAWALNGVATNTYQAGAQLVFIHRDQQALITQFLSEKSMLIPAGFPVTGMKSGDYWDAFALGATAGQKVYANFADGSSYAAATGTPPTAFSGTGSVASTVLNVSAITANSITGSIAGNVLTVTAVSTGAVAPGQTLTGANVVGTPTVVAQLSGTAGGIGTYSLSTSQTSASATIVPSGGTLTVTSLTSGVLAVGQVLTGGANAVAAGTAITAQVSGTVGGAGVYTVNISQSCASTATASVVGSGVLTVSAATAGTLVPGVQISSANITGSVTVQSGITGSGGVGTYFVSNPQTAASAALTSVTGVETPYYVLTTCNAGELAKISTWGY